MKKVAVLGGGGFLGSAVVERLLRAGWAVVIFELPRTKPYRTFEPHEPVEWVSGDLGSVEDLARAIIGVDAVVHLVSTTLPKTSNDDPIFDVQSNLVMTLRLLKLMVEYKVPRIVFVSSGGTVYGSPQYLPIDERHPTEPQVSYGITKLAIEKYLLMAERFHGLKSVVLRVANPFGPRQRIQSAQGAVGVFLDLALRKQPIMIWGDGSVVRDYIYVDDVARAFHPALTYDGPYSVFNIASGVGTSLNELMAQIGDVLGWPVERQYQPGRSFDVQANVLSNALAREELGWVPKYSLHEGIRLLVEHLRSSPPALPDV